MLADYFATFSQPRDFLAQSEHAYLLDELESALKKQEQLQGGAGKDKEMGEKEVPPPPVVV